jgi:asparagine synthase (glutamine-hydrolysing)
MCGISGIFHFDRTRQVDRTVLLSMNQRIAHRGPDDDGIYVSENVGLAMRRLSIIDVQSGHQPISNEEGTIWIVYNGEIYNHQELRAGLEARGHHYRTRSDTETIIHLYEDFGDQCVNRLRGMFAFVIWDSRQRRLFAARDRLGIKPFYYYVHHDGTLLFASEIKALLAYPGVKPEFNRRALPEYLAFGYVTQPETLFVGISKLPPGHTLQADETGKLTVAPYWDLEGTPETDPRSRDYYVRTYREMLEQAVSSHLMSDVPLGVFLSGGLDSSTVAALTSRLRREPIQTFSVGYKEEAYSELGLAREVAEHLGSEHHEVLLSHDDFFRFLPKLIWHEDEPVVWPSSVSLYAVAQLARRHVAVVLTGEGSDETLGGYGRYAWTLWNQRADRIYRAAVPSALRHALRQGIHSGPIGASTRRKLQHTFLGRDGTSWSSFYFDNFYAAFSAADQAVLLSDSDSYSVGPYNGSLQFWEKSKGATLQRLLYTDIKTYLVELLMKQDNMSMAASIESRVPFLDHVLVEFAVNIPAQFAIRGLSGKWILKEAAADLLPEKIIHQKKKGFPTPFSAWLQSGSLEEIERMLTEGRSQERSLFRPAVVQQLFSEHRRGYRDHAERIWRLLNLELWQRIFVDQDSALLEADSTCANCQVLHLSESGR